MFGAVTCVGRKMMLAEALEGGFQACARVDGEILNTQCRFDFGVRCNVVFGKLAQTFRIQRQMQKTAELCHTRHKTLVNRPDVRFLTHRFTDDSYQFVGRDRLIIAHIVDAGSDILSNQTLNRKADILHRCKRTQIIKRTQRPRNTLANHTVQQIQITLVARTVNHTRTQNIELLVVRQIL